MAVDHVKAALARLPEQFKRKPKLRALIEALAKPAQAIEDAGQQLLGHSVDTAVGVYLDAIGKIVGQPRNGLTDEDLYRRYVRARIMTNRSRGTVDDLIRVARLVVHDTAARVRIRPFRVASLVAAIDDAAVSPAVADILIDFLRSAASAGVRVVLSTSPAAPAATFCFSNGPGRGFGARARLQISTPHCNTLVVSRRDAATWPTQTLTFLEDPGAPNSGTFTDGINALFEFKSGVTTAADFQAALATSDWLYVKDASTAPGTLTGGADEFGPLFLNNAVAGGKLRGARDR